MYIKICGVTEPATASMALRYGANSIGIVLTPCSKRWVCLGKAMDLADAIRSEAVKPILVFKDESIRVISTAVEKIGDCIVQFHAGTHPNAQEIMQNFTTLVTFSADEFARLSSDLKLNLEEKIQCKTTQLLIDNPIPGSGKPFVWHTFTPPDFNWILAGGLNATNLPQAKAQLSPTGVDVSSGVEGLDGKKDWQLIQKFIQAAREKI